MTDVFNSMSPEEQAEYIQQVIRTILTDPNPSILDVALLPILATDPRNGFSEETQKELMHAFTNYCKLSEQMAQINMSHADMSQTPFFSKDKGKAIAVWNQVMGAGTAKVKELEKRSETMMIWEGKCSNCGAYTNHEMNYCFLCGSKLEWE